MKFSTKLVFLVAVSAIAPFAACGEDMADCYAGWEAHEAGEHMRSAELTSRCLANGELSNASAARAWRNLGIALRSAGRAEKAIEAFVIAISMEPDDAWMDHVNMGNAYSDLGQFKSALEQYDLAQKIADNPGEVHFNRGVVYERMADIEKAKREFLKAFDAGLRSAKLGERVIAHGLYERVADFW